MSPVTLFIASSTAARPQAKALVAALTGNSVSFLPWWESFTPGRTLLSELDAIRQRADGALIVLSPEYVSTVRGKVVQIPNLNVLFEFGFFYGAYPKERVAIVRYGNLYLPSDLDGYIHITGSAAFRRGSGLPVGKKTLSDFARWVASPGFAHSQAETEVPSGTQTSRAVPMQRYDPKHGIGLPPPKVIMSRTPLSSILRQNRRR